MIYLYVKTHTKTGLKYFGKTTQADPMKYEGSGKYWRRHLKQHGDDVITEIIGSFNSLDECTPVAIKFSVDNDIVNSPLWANLIAENGADGAPVGHIGHVFTPEQKETMSEKLKLRWKDVEYKDKLSKSYRESWTAERKQSQSNRLTGVKRPDHAAALKGRIYTEEHKKSMRKPKHAGHGARVSAATRGVPKSEDHKKSLRKPKPLVVTRIHDRRLMCSGSYTRWVKQFTACAKGEILLKSL